PDMASGGPDSMTENSDDKNGAVIEINAFPVVQSAIYAAYGPPTDPPACFVNSYYSRDHLLNDIDDQSHIEHATEYFRNYLFFQEKQRHFRNLIHTIGQ